MAITWQTFPRSRRTPDGTRLVADAFAAVAGEIDSERFDLQSNRVLAAVAQRLIDADFEVETGKKRAEQIVLPVLFGVDGRPEKSFAADAFHPATGTVLEVEAGRAFRNNQFLKDLFQACMMTDARHLVIAVRNTYKNTPDFLYICTFFETLYVSNRLRLPLESVTVLGY